MNELTELRNRIDAIDAELLRLYTERMETVKQIGAFKRGNGIPVFDPEREEEIVASRTAGLPQELAKGGEALVRLLMEESKKLQKSAGNLYLIGMPDCGKTRTARKLAPMLKRQIADTDKLIVQKEGRTIEAIFAGSGEEYFRELETKLLRALAQKGGLIVATGGGMPLREENRRIMHASGTVVFLDRALEKLYGQETAGRPLIAADTPEQVNANIERLCRERRETYIAAADMIVDPDAEGAAERIAELVEAD